MKRITYTFSILFLLSVGWLALFASSVSATNQAVSHITITQVRLTNSLGDPAPDGSYAITFRIFDDSTGGNELWSEAHPAVAVTDGLFAVGLGSITPIIMDSLTRMAAYASPNLFLETQIEADPPMSPRLRLGGALYSAVAMRLHGDIETAPGLLVMLDSLGDTAIVWDAQAAKGIVKEIPPPAFRRVGRKSAVTG